MFFRNLSLGKGSYRCWRSTLDILKRYRTEWKLWCPTHHRPCPKAPRLNRSKTKVPPPSHHQRSRTGNHRDSSKASLQPIQPHRTISCSLYRPNLRTAWSTVRCNISHPTLLSVGRGRRSIEDKYPSWPAVRTFPMIRNVNECTTRRMPYPSTRCRRGRTVE